MERDQRYNGASEDGGSYHDRGRNRRGRSRSPQKDFYKRRYLDLLQQNDILQDENRMLRQKLAENKMIGVTSEVSEPRPSTPPPQQSGQTVPGPINMRQTVPGPVIAQPVAHSTCGNCKGYDHKTSQCWCIQLDGYIHGCVICDSPDHDTSECQEFAGWDKGARVAILVNSRANLPPLRGKNWFHLFESYLKEELKRGKSYKETLQQLNGLPWTIEFSQACRQDPARMEQLHRIMVLDPFARQCPDPNTETWDKAKRYLARVDAEKPARNAKRGAMVTEPRRQGHSLRQSIQAGGDNLNLSPGQNWPQQQTGPNGRNPAPTRSFAASSRHERTQFAITNRGQVFDGSGDEDQPSHIY
ncbi:hypothetical protein NW752_003072 [Fusarium irregulare]|nr:hypothetical protein NW752_003072 [Fusarium irregulare]